MLVNKLINTLQLACESKVAKIMTTALDCLQVSLARSLSPSLSCAPVNMSA